MTEDFALIDFALSARSPAEIAEAIGRVRAGDAAQAEAPAQKGGMLSRILKRGAGGGIRSSNRKGMFIQPTGTLGPAPMTRLVLTDMGYGASQSPVRLTAPVGAGGLTLIEFRESDGEVSGLCEGVSAELRGDEVFYFRHSGSRHPGAHFAFHVYQDGRVTRRAISMSVSGTAPEADWGGMDSGMPHPLETDSLPAPGTPNSDIMTPVRQAAILEALGIDPDTLFDWPGEFLVTLELSDDAGGQPLTEAQAEINRQRQAHAAQADPAPGPDPSPQSPEVAPDPGAQSETEMTWEEEVTQILVHAVEAALPPDQQVAWLDTLTAQLEAGEIETALEEAHRMIAAGDGPEAGKHTTIARLSELFGRG